MTTMPTLETARLILRPFTPEDAAELSLVINDLEIARNTLTIPHPYPAGEAARWILLHQERFEATGDVHFAIVPRDSGRIAGEMGLMVNRDHARAEIGYWLGSEARGRGYAPEAAEAVLRYGFEVAGLNRIFAAHFTRNPASGRVLQKVGMRHEGTHRQALRKGDEFLDAEMYAILRSEWEGR
ncbi:MAG: acetyltransferase [Acidobacteria bacterium]|nr:acetyltransferase [Acidobacteriota bacterium]